MIKKILLIIALISMIVISTFGAVGGTYTTNGYFYMPAYGAYGTDEFDEYNTYMQIADTQIEANKNPFSNVVQCSDYDHPDNAITAISSSNKTLLVTEAETCDANFTVPANVTVKFERGGKWTIDNGITVTFNGQIDAGLWQVFALTGTGVINFGNGSSKNIYPVWWGIDGTDDDVEIQAAIDASSVGSKIVLREGTYTIGTTIDISKNVSFECLGILDSEIGIDCIQLGSASGQFLNSFIKIQEISGTGKATAGKGIIMKNVNYSSVEFGKLIDLDVGIYFDAHGGGGAAENRINGGLITGCSKGIAFSNSANWMEGNIITATILSCDTGLEFTSSGQSSYTHFLGVVDCVGVGGSVDISDNVGLMFFTLYFYRPGSSTINSTSTIISPTGTLFNNMHWTDFDKFSFINLIENGSFELWSSGTSSAPDDWSISGTIARSATKKIDSYSASLTNIADNEGTLQTTLTDVSYYSERQITFGAWIKTDTASRVSLRIFDNEGGGYLSSGSAYHTGDGNWQFLEVTRTLRAGLTENILLRIHISTGTVVTAYSDGAITVEGNFAPAFMKNPTDYRLSDFRRVLTITDGDATPDVSGGEIFITSSNTGATEITDLDLPTVGQIVTIIGGSNTNSSTITDGGNFSLEGNWTASLDKVLYLFVQADNDYVEIGRSAGGGYTNLTSFVDQTAWRVFYSNTAGDVTELALGADGTYLKSNGAAAAPTFATPAGAGDVSKVGTPVDNQVGVWTGDGTIEGTAGLTYDGANFQLTGDIGATGARITKGWLTNLEITNAPSVNGSALSSSNLSDVASIAMLDEAESITGNWVNTTNPWADNEVANNITIDLATLATTITVTDNEATNENNPLCFVAGADPDGGSLGIETDGDLHYNPSTGLLTATGFAGALTGNVTGNCSGSSGSCTGNATTCTTASAGDAAIDFFGAGVDAVTDATTCTNIEGDLLSITTSTLNVTIPADHITYDKMQDTSATNKILGRSTAGAGTIEEITCTSFARSILDDADEATFKATVNLEIGTDVEVDLSNEAGLYAVLSDVALFLEDTIDDTSPELGGELDCGANTIGFTQQTVTYNVTTTTVDWTNSNKATVTFTGNVGTFAFTNPTNPCSVLLKIVQDATGSRVVTAWDADIKWASGGTAPTLSTAANSIDIVSFYWDGTNYFGVASLDFQ